MRLGLHIAARFLKSNKGQTLLIIIGIAIGVSVQVFIGSLIQGLQKSLLDKTIGSSSHITVTSKKTDKKILDYSSLIQKIRDADESIEAVSVALDNAAFLEYGGSSQSILIRGFEMDQADKIYSLYSRIEEGTYPRGDNELILGIDLKGKYNIALNDEVTIINTNQVKAKYKVVGFFDLKVASLNTGWGITTLNAAQNTFSSKESITSIEMQINEENVFLADEIASKVKVSLSRDDLEIVNWKEQNESLLSGLQGQSISSYMIQVFVLISVVISIASVLAITVIQKSKQIGILKAMGIHNSSTSLIFLFEGLILGFFGAVLGILLGLGLSLSFTKFAVNPDGTPVVELYVNYSFIVLSGMIATVASALAALFPALRSSRLNPIDIIRNN